jgi:hypothetical protein
MLRDASSLYRRPLGGDALLSATTASVISPPILKQPRPKSLIGIAVQIITKRKQPGERGVGDTIHRMMGGPGEKFEVWFAAVFGRSCGCPDRIAWLNRKFPYPFSGLAPLNCATASPPRGCC